MPPLSSAGMVMYNNGNLLVFGGLNSEDLKALTDQNTVLSFTTKH